MRRAARLSSAAGYVRPCTGRARRYVLRLALDLQLVLEEPVLEGELTLDPLAPAALALVRPLVVEVHVRPLLILVRRDLGLLVPLEPRLVLRVVLCGSQKMG